MNIRHIILLLFLATCVGASAQHPFKTRKSKAKDTLIVKTYTDSLLSARERIYSAPDSCTEADGRLFRLFSPTTFYHSVAGDYLGSTPVDDRDMAIDMALMNVYLNKPRLVAKSERSLRRMGEIHEEMKTPIRKKEMLVSRADDDVIDNAGLDLPLEIIVKKPNFWKYQGEYYLQMLQNYVSSNWYKGGESNYSVLGTVTLQANYNNKQRFRWDNKLEMRLGLQSSRGDTLHAVRASEDLLRYTGKVGLQASKRWYYTLQLIASTQFMHGLKSNDHTIYSAFMSPLTVNPSVGMDYNVNWLKGNLTGSVHLAPIAYNYTYVRKLAMATRYGIEEGRRTKSDFGSEVTIDLKWQITKDIRWKTRMYAYTTYKRMLMEWENTFTFVVNKYISSNLFLYPRFDDSAKRDDHHGFWQMKEYISLGFNYGF